MTKRTLHLFTGLLAAAAITLAAPATATEPAHGEAAHGDEHAEAAHGDEHADAGHGDDHGEAAHGDDHGEHHGAHFTGDYDGDGTANWLDPDADEQGGDNTYVLTSIGFHVVNLGLLIAIIFFGAGGSIRDGVRTRAIGIRTDLVEADKLRREAAQRHETVTARLASLEQEVGAIEEHARAEAQREAAEVAARADATVARLAETAQRQIADETARARQALRAEAVELAVELAEGIVKNQLQAGDQRRLAEQFLASVDGEDRHV